MNQVHYDSIIIGGSYAGLSAAMALGRSRRNVLIIDAGEPCNAQTPHSHNFLTQDGNSPASISALSKKQVLAYPTVTFKEDFAIKARKENDLFIVETRAENIFKSSTLLISTGVKDIFPDIAGVKACWGISVLHCPYCHGYEVRDKKLGIIANGAPAIDFVKLIRNWSKDIVLLTNGPSEFTPDQEKFLRSVDAPVISHVIRDIQHKDGQLSSVRFVNGESAPLESVFLRLPFIHHTEIAKDLGCDFTETNHIVVDELGRTSVRGVYAAGDCVTPFRTVSLAVAGGTKAGAGMNKDMIEWMYAGA